jgi:hypothetical protein
MDKRSDCIKTVRPSLPRRDEQLTAAKRSLACRRDRPVSGQEGRVKRGEGLSRYRSPQTRRSATRTVRQMPSRSEKLRTIR